MIDGTSLLRTWSHLRLAALDRQDGISAQRRRLHWLLRRARDTRFGRDHGFAGIGSVEQFQRSVPLRRYEDFWEGYWKRDFPVVRDATWPGLVPYFAKTSGTTSGTSKYIPVTREMLRAYRRAIIDMLCFHLRACPQSRVLGGKNFMLGGSTELERLADGVYAGDMSGITAREVPAWARPFYFPKPELSNIADWERKMAVLGPVSLQEDIRTIGGTASWLLFFLQDLPGARDQGLTACYPRLELIAYGGVNFEPYRAGYEELVSGTGVDLREVYPASEGFMAIADRGVGKGMRLLVDGAVFFEFVRADELGAAEPRRFWLGDVGTGINYAVVLNTSGGAWGYVLGDTVRFVDLDPPRILVTGRTASSLSAFGEHLIEEEIVRAVASAADAIGAEISDFSMGPVYPQGEERRGSHLYVVEFGREYIDAERVGRFGERLDSVLCELNEDYGAHRQGNLQMKAPQVIAASPGTFAAWMKSRGKLGGQNKVPRVIHDPDVLADLCRQAIRPDPSAASSNLDRARHEQ